ncbi:MAG: ABC transporter ATP-binding protein [Gaiellaceae bacterium MAG52_C11]|nr:ABC transporter ATP-binding protein [Candidatus Gaiellasilicea maunaloa]
MKLRGRSDRSAAVDAPAVTREDAQAPAIELVGVGKRYGETRALTDFTIDIGHDEFLVLLGPSGCGKSTVLKVVAGLEDATEGEVYINGRLVNYVAPKARDVAMVFQNYALYPHMTVEKNLGFPLKMTGRPKAEVRERVREAARLLELEPELSRYPEQLSGGQRQRVALGRAIVRNPVAFLMDEPLSNLDALLRVQMRDELQKLHRRVGRTTVYVTHDQTEAMTMADRIVVLRSGLVQQVGTPDEVYRRPTNTFVASFVGSPQMNLFEGRAEARDGVTTAVSPAAAIPLSGERYPEGEEVTFGVRPEDVLLTVDGERGAVAGVVTLVEPMGPDVYLDVALADDCSCLVRAPADTKVAEGERIHLRFRSEKIHLFDAEGVRIPT